MEILESWRKICQKIIQNPGRVLILGKGTSGKTSFTAYLASEGYRFGLRTGVLDMDIGQSNIGPPTTMSVGIVENNITKLFEIKPSVVYFVGTTSPLSPYAQSRMIEGMKNLMRFADGCNLFIVESIPYLKNRRFMSSFISLEMEIIAPKHIVILLKPSELPNNLSNPEDFFAEKETEDGGKIFTLAAPFNVKPKSPNRRRKFRVESWLRYLENGLRYQIGKKLDIWEGEITMMNVAVGFLDKDNNFSSIGVLYNSDNDYYMVFAPYFESQIVRVVIGQSSVEDEVIKFIKSNNAPEVYLTS